MESNPNNGKKKGLLVGLGLFTAGILSFFGYQYWKSNKKKGDVTDNKSPEFKAEKPKASKTNTSKPKKKAPIKKQEYKTKPTSDKKTDAEKNNPASNITNTLKQKAADPSLIAKGIYVAIKTKSFNAALRILKAIKSPLQYAEVGRFFNKYFIGGVRQTIVNALLTTFKSEEQKQNLKQAFIAIGLKYDGKKWSLEGISDRQLIITTQSTKVWKDPQNWVEVPADMVLGKEIAKRKDHTLFENDKRYFLVPSQHVNIYNN